MLAEMATLESLNAYSRFAKPTKSRAGKIKSIRAEKSPHSLPAVDHHHHKPGGYHVEGMWGTTGSKSPHNGSRSHPTLLSSSDHHNGLPRSNSPKKNGELKLPRSQHGVANSAPLYV